MVPVAHYCRICGGYTKTLMGDDPDKIMYKDHTNLEDCVALMQKNIEKLFAILGAEPEIL